MQPLTYIFMPGKYLLHSTTGTMNTIPTSRPNSRQYRNKNRYRFVTKDEAKTEAEYATAVALRTKMGWVISEK